MIYRCCCGNSVFLLEEWWDEDDSILVLEGIRSADWTTKDENERHGQQWNWLFVFYQKSRAVDD